MAVVRRGDRLVPEAPLYSTVLVGPSACNVVYPGRLFVPPIRRVAPLLTVSVPPAAVQLTVTAPRCWKFPPSFPVRLLFTGEATPSVSVPLGLLTTRLLNASRSAGDALHSPEPLKLKTPVPELNAPVSNVPSSNEKLPPMFVVLSLPLNTPPWMTKSVGEIALPGLFVQDPLVVAPGTASQGDVRPRDGDRDRSRDGAAGGGRRVAREGDARGAVPFSVRPLPPATIKIAPPRLLAEFDVNEVVETVPPRLPRRARLRLRSRGR